QPPGDPQRDGEHLRRVADVRTGPVDHLPPLFQHLSGRGPEHLLLAIKVVVEGPEASISASSVISAMLARSPRPSAISRTAASTPAGTAAGALTSRRGAIQARPEPREVSPGTPRTTIPSRPVSSAGRVPGASGLSRA